jgi:hypothetical protein
MLWAPAPAGVEGWLSNAAAQLIEDAGLAGSTAGTQKPARKEGKVFMELKRYSHSVLLTAGHASRSSTTA